MGKALLPNNTRYKSICSPGKGKGAGIRQQGRGQGVRGNVPGQVRKTSLSVWQAGKVSVPGWGHKAGR